MPWIGRAFDFFGGTIGRHERSHGSKAKAMTPLPRFVSIRVIRGPDQAVGASVAGASGAGASVAGASGVGASGAGTSGAGASALGAAAANLA